MWKRIRQLSPPEIFEASRILMQDTHTHTTYTRWRAREIDCWIKHFMLCNECPFLWRISTSCSCDICTYLRRWRCQWSIWTRQDLQVECVQTNVSSFPFSKNFVHITSDSAHEWRCNNSWDTQRSASCGLRSLLISSASHHILARIANKPWKWCRHCCFVFFLLTLSVV